MILKGIDQLPLNEIQKIQLAGEMAEDLELLFRYGTAIATEASDEGTLGDLLDQSLDQMAKTWLGFLTRGDIIHLRRQAVEAQRDGKHKELIAELRSLSDAA
jgi:hypothetical protein